MKNYFKQELSKGKKFGSKKSMKTMYLIYIVPSDKSRRDALSGVWQRSAQTIYEKTKWLLPSPEGASLGPECDQRELAGNCQP